VLGLPAGRTPRSTLAALSRRALDLAGLHVVMMDEFVGARGHEPHSCRRFALDEVLPALGPGVHLHVPDERDPDGYERLLDSLGGIDAFVLASGATDGHVAFNQPGTGRHSRTRVVDLAAPLRRDNLGTFPSFATVDDVPRQGVTVGLGTIADRSRRVVLLLLGPAKATSAGRIRAAGGFDPAWPATIVHECPDPLVVSDIAES
jgi:glucosamine-6-phosphate deaminase